MIKKMQNNRNKGNLFKESLDFIIESRKYIYASLLIFLVSAVFGFIFADKLSFINEILKNLVDKTEGLGTVELMVFIFLNNLQSAFFGMMLGILFGIVPVINAVTNGVVLGFVFEKVYNVSGFSDFWRILPHGIFELPAIFIALGLGMKLGLDIIFTIKNINFKELIKRLSLFIVLLFLFKIIILTQFDMMIKIVLLIIIFSLFVFISLKMKRNDIFDKEFYIQVKKAFYAFLLVILPLLVIAAIIEGLLISFGR